MLDGMSSSGTGMRVERSPGAMLVLAVLLSALLPLEPAHCAWMAASSAPHVPANPDERAGAGAHACCPEPQAPARQNGPDPCPCELLPLSTLPTSVTLLPARSHFIQLATVSAETPVQSAKPQELGRAAPTPVDSPPDPPPSARGSRSPPRAA